MLVAHSQNDAREWHGLTDHLDKVATLAATFSAEWGDTLWAGLAGAWHDLGKARPGFQRHICHDPDAHIEGRVPGAEKTHSAAGGLHARSEFGRLLDARSADSLARVLQYLIAGHHAGLADWQPQDGHSGLAPRLASAAARTEYDEALQGLAEAGETLRPAPDAATLTSAARALLGQQQPGAVGQRHNNGFTHPSKGKRAAGNGYVHQYGVGHVLRHCQWQRLLLGSATQREFDSYPIRLRDAGTGASTAQGATCAAEGGGVACRRNRSRHFNEQRLRARWWARVLLGRQQRGTTRQRKHDGKCDARAGYWAAGSGHCDRR